MTRRVLVLWSVWLLLGANAGHAQTGPTCSLAYNLPADIPVPTSQADASTFQQFGWQSFLALNSPSVGGAINTGGDNRPQWSSWSSTVDLLSCQGTPTPQGCVCANGDCARSGTRYYPTACRGIPNYQRYRVLSQVGKLDDSFEEAAVGGLSGDPVIDRFGHFLRYEILVSPATYAFVIDQQLYDEAHLQSLTSDINMPCGVSTYTGGNPANPQMGALVMKVAWMNVEEAIQQGTINLASYHLEPLLVYTPAYRNSTQEPSCQLQTMAMIGQHFEHKTTNQPNWIWTTFEHNANAPDCTASIPAAPNSEPNTSCPSVVSSDFNLFAQDCSDNAPSCAACNTAPATNGTCVNPDTSTGKGWCLDQAPNPAGGVSKLCRQVPVASYPEADAWNSACQTALGIKSAWANYQLVSSQWGTSAIPAGCANVARTLNSTFQVGGLNPSLIDPVPAPPTPASPFLGNTSMESYGKSNCTGCHVMAHVVTSSGNTVSTDFMYWLQLEVAAAGQAGNRVGASLRKQVAYHVEYLGNTCTARGAAVATYRVTRSLLRTTSERQTFDLLVGVQFPSHVGAPTVALTHLDPRIPVRTLRFKQDACEPGACQVDREFPASARQQWIQYRSASPVSLDHDSTGTSALMTVTFPPGTCQALLRRPFRIWLVDNSELLYANRVDGVVTPGAFSRGLRYTGPE